MDADSASAWVLEAQGHDLKRAVRATRALEPERVVALADGAVCVQLADPPAPPRRLERRLGHPVEARLDCDVAHYAEGRGYYVLLVGRGEDPDDGLDAVLDAEGLAYRETVRTSVLDEPARVCVPKPAVADLRALSASIASAGLPVLAIYEVGACSRR